MAELSHSKKLHKLDVRAKRVGEMRRQYVALRRTIKRETRAVVKEGHEMGLNNAEIARMIGPVTAEHVRQVAEEIGSENPRAIGPRHQPSPDDQS